MAQSRAESTRDTCNYGQYINQFPQNTIKVIREFERIQKKICRHKMSLMFNEICVYISIYIYIYIYIHTYIHTHTLYIYTYIHIPFKMLQKYFCSPLKLISCKHFKRIDVNRNIIITNISDLYPFH